MTKPATRSRQPDAFADMNRELGTIPPQALDLEAVVLGALMIERDAIMSVQDVLTPECFYKEAHRYVYRAILDLSARLEPIDLFTVAQRVQANGHMAAIGGPAFLAGLTTQVGSAAHVEFHALIIKQKAIQRELIRAGGTIVKKAYDNGVDVSDLLDFAESTIFKIAENSVKRDVQKASDVLTKAMAAIEAATQKKGASGIQSGFADLDRLTCGWQPSDLVIVAARPSMGKTAFVLTMARNIAVDQRQGVAFFSLEMSAEQLMTRLIVAESGIPSQAIRTGNIPSDRWAALERSIAPLNDAPLFIDDTPALSIFEFRSKARKLKIQHDIQLIVIDYLQLMTGDSGNNNSNREQEVASISRTLKAVAKELNVPIIALSQLNRSVESRGGNKRPQLSDLRESGAIEQDADLVAFIHRPEYYGLTEDEDGFPTAGIAEVIVAKHRNGAVDTVKMRFIRDQAKFADMNESNMSSLNNFNYEHEKDTFL